ncbi:hypothetical protein AAVH_17195 [Aphelenchoides avenae]|nr:hypothetical protein AAVH_17195 [Aphelenchus avenae]
MRRNCAIILVFLFGAADATSRDNVMKKTRNLITDFLTAPQAGQVWDLIRNDLYALKTTAQVTSTLRSKVTGTLSGTQAQQFMGIYNNLVNALGGSAKAEKTFNKVLTVLTNNLGPLADQVRAKVKTMKANGKAQNAVYNQEYYMFDLYLTKERVKTIMARIKGKVTAAEWKAIRNQLTNVVLFAKHGL